MGSRLTAFLLGLIMIPHGCWHTGCVGRALWDTFLSAPPRPRQVPLENRWEMANVGTEGP